MFFCKDCIYCTLEDDYWRLGRWSVVCTLTGNLTGLHDSCEEFLQK